jgi:hypothetical protein
MFLHELYKVANTEDKKKRETGAHILILTQLLSREFSLKFLLKVTQKTLYFDILHKPKNKISQNLARRESYFQTKKQQTLEF